MDLIKIIQQKTFKPIKLVELSSPPRYIYVHFQDGSLVKDKNDIKLRLFLSIIQQLNFERIHGCTSHCVIQPLNQFKLLGFCSGDAIKFYKSDNVSFFILFS